MVMAENGEYTSAEVLPPVVEGSETSSTGGNSMLFNAEPVNEVKAREFLRNNAWPPGLQDALIKGLKKIPIRYIICDDSGSMTTNDGMKFERYEDIRVMSTCSRWSELAECLAFHADLAHNASAPTEFRLLNHGPPVRVGFTSTKEGKRKSLKSAENQLAKFKTQLKDPPFGQTPLCRHISEVVAQIQLVADELRQNGQLACLVIASDGEATDGRLAKVMKALKDLPVWVVVRLCTNDPVIIKYWNDIDQELELNMDVLDDFHNEGIEVKNLNPWLTYGEPLHRMREFGVHIKELDLLDEQPCMIEQVRQIAAVIFGGRLDDYPHPEADFAAFKQYIAELNNASPFVLGPVSTSGKERPWIKLYRLKLDPKPPKEKSKCVIC